MNKQTKLYLGIGLVLVAGYLVYKNMTKTNPSTTTEDATASFTGMKRKRMVGVNAEKGKFFDVQSSDFKG